MKEKNRDYAVLRSGMDCEWVFVIPSDAERCSEQSREMLETCAGLFDCCEDYIVPTRIKYKSFLFAEDVNIPVERGDTDNKIEALEQELESSSGLDFGRLRESIESKCDHTSWIPNVHFPGVKVKLRLENGDKFVDRTRKSHLVVDGEMSTRTPPFDPLRIDVNHVKNSDEPDIDPEFVTYVKVDLQSDIWFEDSTIGEANRAYLQSFFACLEERLAVTKVTRWKDWPAGMELEEIF